MQSGLVKSQHFAACVQKVWFVAPQNDTYFPDPMLLSIKQSQFRISVPEDSGVALCEAVSTPHGFGYRKSRFQPGIHIHMGIFSAHLRIFLCPLM